MPGIEFKTKRKRFAHRLKANEHGEYPHFLIFFDIETTQKQVSSNEIEHEFKMGSAIFWHRRSDGKQDTVQRIIFYNPQEFYKFVISHVYAKSKLYLISHNLDFDASVAGLYSFLLNQGYKVDEHWENEQAKYWYFKKEDKSIVLMDNANYFRGKLEDIGKSIGIEKYEIDFDNCTCEELERYNMRDTEILFELWRKWINFCIENDFGTFGKTLASQSFNTYRHRFMHHDIFIHDNEEVLKLERSAYFGGRVEAFYVNEIRDKTLYKLDINSMYPHVMRDYEYPTKFKTLRKDVNVEFLKHYIDRYCMVAKVRVKTPEKVFPIRCENGVNFVSGEFDTVLCTEELRYALERNYILKVYEVALYDKAHIFRDFVDELYDMRIKFKHASNNAFAYFVKILMNSLYGKFGQKTPRWTQIGTTESKDCKVYRIFDENKQRWYTIREFMGIIEQTQDDGEAFNSFPAISAHVTANARMFLYKLMKTAGLKHVFYCDTDSLFVDEIGYKRLHAYVNNEKLGMLKLEETANYFKAYTKKDYVFGGKIVRKGVKSSAREIEENVFEQEQWQKFASRLREGHIERYTVKIVRKHLKRNITSGKVCVSGWVIPWVFPEDENRMVEAIKRQETCYIVCPCSLTGKIWQCKYKMSG